MAQKTTKGQTPMQLGIDDKKKPATHGSGIYHSVHVQVTHDSEYATKSGSLPNPVQPDYPANTQKGGSPVRRGYRHKLNV
jgi:hypothetical protein